MFRLYQIVLKHLRRNHQYELDLDYRYSLIESDLSEDMKLDGSKIIFGLGVASAVATMIIALYFAIQ